MNKACIIDFESPLIVKRTDNCQKLLKMMLEADPKDRPSAIDCLKQGYFEEVVEGDSHVQRMFMLYGH